jgi:VWFA-related protein
MNFRTKATALFLLLAGTVLTAGQSAQPSAPQAPTFKAQVEYVEVDALVTDQQGNFVRDLKKEDFQVFEDGKLQTISTFTLVDIPIERSERPLFAERPIEPDVQSNERPFDGRVYVLILDDLHTDALRSQRVKIAARQFIERNLGANDLMAVLFTSGRSQDAQEFTTSKRLLLKAVDKFMGSKLPGLTIARNEAYFRTLTNRSNRVPDPYDQERAYNARSVLTQLKQVADWFGGVHGRRKTLLLMSEGIDYDITDLFGSSGFTTSAGSVYEDIRDAVSAAARANVSIYAIDPRGLTLSGDDTIGVGSFADSDSGANSLPDLQGGASSGPPRDVGLSAVMNDLRRSQDSLRWLADESGGFAAVNTNEFSNAFARIVRDNSSYYVMAYYPQTTKRDGKFHKIEVKVTRPGLTVRSRRGYAAPKGKAPDPKNVKTGGLSPELFEAINSPIPISGLTMRAFGTPFKGTQPNASVVVGVEMVGRDLTLDNNNKIELSWLAVDNKGKAWGTRNDSLSLNLRPETRARVEQSGLRMLNRIELPPGRYQLRLAARDSAKSNVGTIIYDLDVPDFFKAPFSMSGIVLTSLSGAAMATAKNDEQLKAVLPAPPIGQRSFPQNDEIALFAEIYDNTAGTPHKVDIVTTIIADEGRVLFKTEESRDSSELQGAKGGFGYTARVPLNGVPPGLYVLRVEGRSRLGQNQTARREVQFNVVPARTENR